MRRLLFIVGICFLCAAPMCAQGVLTAQWAQPSPLPNDPTWPLTQAQGYQYALYIDALPKRIVVATCTGTVQPFTCSAPVPGALASGPHTVTLTATDVTDPTTPQESAPSVSVPFTIPRPKPGVPVTLTIVVR